MGRDQATSRGSLGVYSAISHRPIRTKQRPNQQQNAAPLRLRRVVDTWPEAAENRISTTPRARAARHREVPVLCLKHRWLQNAASFAHLEKFWHPSHPTVAPSPQEGGRHPTSRLECKPMQLQGNTVLVTGGKLANCGKIAHGIGV